jgi:hypothetical protein
MKSIRRRMVTEIIVKQLNVVTRAKLIHPDLVLMWKEISYYEKSIKSKNFFDKKTSR